MMTLENKSILDSWARDTDKGSRKNAGHNFISIYKNYVHDETDVHNLFEIGVDSGGSAKLWLNMFPEAHIYMLDNSKEKLDNLPKDKRIKPLLLNEEDIDQIHAVLEGKLFDIIIDDGSHICKNQIKSFFMHFSKLEFGGIYVIEDLNTSFNDPTIENPLDMLMNYFKTGKMTSIDWCFASDEISFVHFYTKKNPKALHGRSMVVVIGKGLS